jgi:uncharacterized membrane protein YeaQ/YmgE (transglycosylase-associated protein family)
MQSTLQLLFSAIGVSILILDILRFTKSSFRERIATFLNAFVLDDFLRFLHDPETGVIPCLVGSFMGAYSMYGLRLDNEQKTRLLQASLWTGKEEARSILLDAGGTKALLPESIQEWLSAGSTTTPEKPIHSILRPNPVTVETVEEEMESNSSDSDYANLNGVASPRPASPECTLVRRTRAEQMHGAQPKEVSFQRHQPMPPPGIPTDPVLEMLKIVRDIAVDKLRPWFASIPENEMEILGTVAAVGLCAQMIMRTRSKRSFFGTLIAMGLSGTVAGAFCTVLLRQTILGSIRDYSSFNLVSSAVLSRSLQRIKGFVTKDKRISTAVALFVLALVGQKNQRFSFGPPNRYRGAP